jgi:hypothetical protein
VYGYVTPLVGSVNCDDQYLIVFAVRNPVVPPSVVNFGVPSPVFAAEGFEPPAALPAKRTTSPMSAEAATNRPSVRFLKSSPFIEFRLPNASSLGEAVAI